jgi:hypothetical protein
MSDTTADADLVTNLQPLVTSLLANHAYGVCELAQECAQQLHEPLCEIFTPLTDSLRVLVNRGIVSYDRQHNQVALA